MHIESAFVFLCGRRHAVLTVNKAARIFKGARAVLLGGRVLIGNAGAVYRFVQLGGIAPDKVNRCDVFKPAELEVHVLIMFIVEFPYAVVARIRLVCCDFERVDIGCVGIIEEVCIPRQKQICVPWVAGRVRIVAVNAVRARICRAEFVQLVHGLVVVKAVTAHNVDIRKIIIVHDVAEIEGVALRGLEHIGYLRRVVICDHALPYMLIIFLELRGNLERFHRQARSRFLACHPFAAVASHCRDDGQNIDKLFADVVCKVGRLYLEFINRHDNIDTAFVHRPILVPLHIIGDARRTGRMCRYPTVYVNRCDLGIGTLPSRSVIHCKRCVLRNKASQEGDLVGKPHDVSADFAFVLCQHRVRTVDVKAVSGCALFVFHRYGVGIHLVFLAADVADCHHAEHILSGNHVFRRCPVEVLIKVPYAGFAGFEVAVRRTDVKDAVVIIGGCFDDVKAISSEAAPVGDARIAARADCSALAVFGFRGT